ncbi:MAG: glycine cleavage system protein H [Phototrophicales bacterium]|nr:MAG: glycine cleavage system protein H [Phototrophicales bacterium]
MALKFPSDLKYLKSDEWLRIEGETGTIGISDFAQDQLNDVVYVDLPEVGRTLAAGESFGSVESVKAASELVTPVAGEVIAVNDDLEKTPELVNSDPYGKGWMVRIRITDASAADSMMDAAAYEEYCKNR